MQKQYIQKKCGSHVKVQNALQDSLIFKILVEFLCAGSRQE